MTDRDLIKEAEQNILNVCLHLKELIELFRTLRHRSSNYCDSHLPRHKKMDEGFELILEALYEEQCEQLSKLILFYWIGGEEAIKYSRSEFERIFSGDDKMIVMDLLDKHGQIPRSWLSADEEELRKQAKGRLDDENP